MCEGRRLKKREEDSLHLCFSSQTYTTHTYTQSLKCWCHLSGPHHYFAYCGNLSRVNWLGFLWFINICFLRDTINSIKCVGVECLPCASQQPGTKHFNSTVCSEVKFFCDFLISAALSIQGVDLRYDATFPGEMAIAICQWECHSWTQL